MNRRTVPALSLLLLALAGCQGAGTQPDRVRDGELRARGEWTAGDELARRLVGPEVAPSGELRPVRRGALLQRLRGLEPAVLTLFGWCYEPRLYHAREAGAWVLLVRERPAVVVGEAFAQPVEAGEPGEREEALARFERRLGRELASLPRPGPRTSPSPAPLPDVQP